MNAKKPTVINLPITEKCDSRCVMCNVWNAGKEDAFSGDTIRDIFSQTLFSDVLHIGLSGGEPTLNEDITQIVSQLCLSLPKLKTLSLTSHGYHTDKHKRILPAILEYCQSKGISFSLNLSLDGFAENHEKVRRIPRAFEKVTTTAALAKSLGVRVQYQCTISRSNVYGIVAVREFALDSGSEIIFRVASQIERLSNSNLSDVITLSEKEKSFVADFLNSSRTIFAANSLSRRLFYKDLAHRLVTLDSRKAPCIFKTKGLFVSPSKEIYHCSRSKTPLTISDNTRIEVDAFSDANSAVLSNLIESTCTSCYHDQNGRWRYWEYLSVHKKAFPILKILNKISHIPRLVYESFVPYAKPDKHNSSSCKRMLLVGCYGGEHVGDAAILGGVILRLSRKYRVTQFDVLSFRPDRTKCWVENLSIDGVIVNVISDKTLDDITDYDAIVWAGGPLMSLPIILTNVSRLVRWFKKKGKKFYIEGAGVGPINDLFTKNIIRKLIASSDNVSFRTKRDFDSGLEFNSSAEKTIDPAFDYIELEMQRGYDSKTCTSLDAILNTEKEIWVVNLRPLWSRYLSGNESSDLEANCISSISESIAAHSEGRRFVFMPMNADQFGFSDLEAGYKLRKELQLKFPAIDFVLWEHEPTISECVKLLKRSSLMLSMRFHGCIFALGCNVPTIGLDYSTGAKGKVFSLLDDRGLGANSINIQNVSTDKLKDLIATVLSGVER